MSQEVQLEVPVLLAYLPPAHFVHEDASAAEYRPSAQAVAEAERIVQE